jgi:lipoyl(octanoyl) transferase
MVINVVDLGLIGYNEALEIQKRLQQRRIQKTAGDTLLLLEHSHVITLGTRANPQNIYVPQKRLEELGVEVAETDRGGDVTYHGPGQIVGYLIFDLAICGNDIRLFIKNIEGAIIDLLKERFGIDAYPQSGRFTGIWVNDKKIAAIGISVSRRVTMHGFAFNVNTDLKYFDLIKPCGLSKGVTSLEEITGQKQDMALLNKLTAEYLAKKFNCEYKTAKLDGYGK